VATAIPEVIGIAALLRRAHQICDLSVEVLRVRFTSHSTTPRRASYAAREGTCRQRLV
jgi:hypothetical protein